MAENNENKKVTAQELLARLSRPAAQTDAEKSSFASPNSMDPEELLSKFAEKKKQYSEPEEVPEAADPAFDGAFGEKEDLHSEDDFFDNDPVQEEIYLDAEPAEEDPVTYDPATDFESLVNEVTGEETGAIDETDISLMVALGMEDELAKSVGAETAAQMTDDYVADQEEWVTRSKRYGPGEYSDPADFAYSRV